MNVINKSTLENKKSPWLEQKLKKKIFTSIRRIEELLEN